MLCGKEHIIRKKTERVYEEKDNIIYAREYELEQINARFTEMNPFKQEKVAERYEKMIQYIQEHTFPSKNTEL